jgi:hypothetical protein
MVRAGTTPPEQFIPIRIDNATTPIQPGEQMFWMSVQVTDGLLRLFCTWQPALLQLDAGPNDA